MAFVTVLSFSRQIFLRFFLDARMENFLRGHLGAFAARTFAGLDDLNAQADAWCRGLAADRRCPEDQTRSVAEVFAEEVPRLLPLPDNPYPVVEHVAVKAGKTPYVRFDQNDYSVPHSYVMRTLTVLADPGRLRIVDGQAIVAPLWHSNGYAAGTLANLSHPRSYDKAQRIEDPADVQALGAWKREARRHRATDRLTQAAPSGRTLLVRAAEHGANLGSIAASLVLLLERMGRTNSMPPSPRRSSAMCRTLLRVLSRPTRFAWRSNAAAMTASRPH